MIQIKHYSVKNPSWQRVQPGVTVRLEPGTTRIAR